MVGSLGFCGMILVVTEGALLKERNPIREDPVVRPWARLLPGSVPALGLGSRRSVATSPERIEEAQCSLPP